MASIGHVGFSEIYRETSSKSKNKQVGLHQLKAFAQKKKQPTYEMGKKNIFQPHIW